MNVSEAIASRRSVRAFLPREVPLETVRELLAKAARAPSGGNLQPWKVYVLTGDSRDALVARMREDVMTQQQPEYNVYPPDIKPEYHERRRTIGYALYEALGIARDDRAARMGQNLRNFEFFDAPVGLFFTVDRQMDKGQWADVGMFMQNLMLLARERGLDSCPQEAWANFPESVGEHLQLPAHEILFCGMALGYADPDHASATVVSEREEVDQFSTFLS